MGLFDLMCQASGIVLDGRTRLLFLLEDEQEKTVPFLPPLCGTYDRYGKIENIAPGPVRSAAEALVERLEMDDLDSVIDEAFEPGIELSQRKLRYALIDDLVYRAMVATAASAPEADPNLEALPFEELVARALGAPELALPLLAQWENDEVLRHELAALVLFMKMCPPLRVSSPDSDSGQYIYFHRERAGDDIAAETETRKAEAAFAEHPLVLAAIAENERVWIEREKENLEGDDDDEDDDEDDDDDRQTYTVDLDPPKGHSVPQLLSDFGAWLEEQDHGTVGYFDCLSLEAAPKQAAPDKKTGARLNKNAMCFLSLPDGSQLALLEGAVVLLGSEGAMRTVADSLEEFLFQLADASTRIMELDDEDAGSGRKKLFDWLERKKVVVPEAKTFDFHAWLDDEIPHIEPPLERKDSEEIRSLPPKLQSLARLVGRRADDPELVRYVREELGMRVPSSTTDMDDDLYVVAPKVGVELLFSHDVLHEAYPPVKKTKSSFVPYLQHVWLRKNFPEPLPFGLKWKISEKEATKLLGSAERMAFFVGEEKKTPYWEKPLGAGVVLHFDIRKDGLAVEFRIDAARQLGIFDRAQQGVFLAWALTRDLLDASRFPDAVYQAVKARTKHGSDLAPARGLWDSHLRDDEELRDFAYEYGHGIGGKSFEGDLRKTFGTRTNADGDKEPKLDDDTWDAVDKATPVLDKRFAKWL